MYVILRLFLILIAIFSFCIFSFAQDSQFHNSETVVPQNVAEQFVRRILIWSFKESKKHKTVYILDKGIKESWLPSIKNIKFKLISAEEAGQKEKKVYFFTHLEQSKNIYKVSFVYGDSNCEFDGPTWYFRIVRQKIKLWQNGGLGAGCGSGYSY